MYDSPDLDAALNDLLDLDFIPDPAELREDELIEDLPGDDGEPDPLAYLDDLPDPLAYLDEQPDPFAWLDDQPDPLDRFLPDLEDDAGEQK